MTRANGTLRKKVQQNVQEEWFSQQEQRQRQDQDKEDFQEPMLWVCQGGSIHCGVPQNQGEKKGHQQE
jgi:hypothetical protein